MRIKLPNLPRKARNVILIAVILIGLVAVIANKVGGTSRGTAAATSGRTGATGFTDGQVPFDPNATTDSSSPAPTGSKTTSSGDDGTDDTPPVLVQPTTQPGVKETASAFAAAWLNTFGKNAETWRYGLNAYLTADEATALANADPESVPAGCRVGTVTVTQQGDLHGADVQVVTDETTPKAQGTLTLTMVQRNGSWLVSEIDWKAQR